MLSHRLKDDTKGSKHPAVFLSMVLEVKLEAESDPLLKMVVSDCKLAGGVLKPPSRPGGFVRNFFPQVYFLNGIKNNPMAAAIYKIVEELCEKYNLPLAPIEECLESWMPDKKVFQNFQNMTLGENEIIWKNS